MSIQNTNQGFFHGVGRRKCAIACARLYEDKGKKGIILKKGIIINGMPFEEYFEVFRWRNRILQPLQVTNQAEELTIICKIIGGGKRAQADALSLGISRALEKMDGDYKSILKTHKLLTRDSREKERKKPGQKGARAKFQYGKR